MYAYQAGTDGVQRPKAWTCLAGFVKYRTKVQKLLGENKKLTGVNVSIALFLKAAAPYGFFSALLYVSHPDAEEVSQS